MPWLQVLNIFLIKGKNLCSVNSCTLLLNETSFCADSKVAFEKNKLRPIQSFASKVNEQSLFWFVYLTLEAVYKVKAVLF